MNVILYFSSVTHVEFEAIHERQSATTGLKIQKEKEKSGLPSSTQPSHAWASHIQEHGHYQEHGRSGTEQHHEVLTNKNHINRSHTEVLSYFCNWKCLGFTFVLLTYSIKHTFSCLTARYRSYLLHLQNLPDHRCCRQGLMGEFKTDGWRKGSWSSFQYPQASFGMATNPIINWSTFAWMVCY